MDKKNQKKAFTLAEVLLTLAIVGIVAAMTIPALISNVQNLDTIAKIRKHQSIAQQSIKIYMMQNSISDLSASGLFNGTQISILPWNAFKPGLNLMKDCGTGSGCFSPGVAYKRLNGTTGPQIDNNTNLAKGILADGSSIYIEDYGGNCNYDYSRNNSGPLYTICGSFCLDVNGSKGPNQNGIDFFAFNIAKDGTIYPYGALDHEYYGCSRTGTLTASDGYAGNGIGCAKQIITEGKMDY